MNHHTGPTSEKAPGVSDDSKGLATDTTNDLNFATGTRNSKAVTTQIAELALRGHVVHTIEGGGFMVCKYGYCYLAKDFADMQVFARRLGVSQ